MVDIYVLDKNREVIDTIDSYESLIWTPRHFECGDFEIYIKATPKLLETLQLDNYVTRVGSEMVGIIEKIEIESDPDRGDHIVVSGRCAKSILSRRIIWSQTNIKGTVENGIRTILTENLVSPSLSYRRIENFVLGPSQGFTETLSTQYTGEDVLEVVVNLCKQYGYGSKVILNAEKNFEFILYRGVDRSLNQTTNPYVVFSQDFENVISSNYVHDKSALKNACNVAGEGEGVSRKTYGVGTVSGLDRREMFVDARDISSELEDGSAVTSDEYNELLIQRGRDVLAENPEMTSFEGEVESTRQYVFGEDFFLGDIVTVVSNHGIVAHTRVVGVIQSHDENGELTIPTFSSMEVYE